MIDVAAYALLKRGISTSGATSNTIADARIENGHLLLILTDGTTIDCGALPAAGIDDATVSSETTWSSEQIVRYHTAGGGLSESEVRAIALEVAEDAISELMPSTIIGGEPISYINGGEANSEETDIIYGMDADEEPVGVDITLEGE